MSNTNIYLDAKTSFLEPQVNQYGGHMVMSNVKKATRFKYLNIDTRFIDEYSIVGTDSYILTFPERLRNIKSIRVVSVETPISFYNYSSSLGNNSLKITKNISGTITNYSIDISNGMYFNSQQLITQLNGQIHASRLSGALSNLSFSTTPDNNNTILTATSTGTYVIQFNTDISGNQDRYHLRSKLGWGLGFKKFLYSLTSSSPIISESMINLNTIRYLYLVVDEYTSGFTNSFICPVQDYLLNKKILARISLDSSIFPFGTVQISNTFNALLSSDIRQYNGTVDIQKMSIQLVNEYGVPVDLNGQDFSFLLELSYE